MEARVQGHGQWHHITNNWTVAQLNAMANQNVRIQCDRAGYAGILTQIQGTGGAVIIEFRDGNGAATQRGFVRVHPEGPALVVN